MRLGKPSPDPGHVEGPGWSAGAAELLLVRSFIYIQDFASFLRLLLGAWAVAGQPKDGQTPKP